MVVVINQGAKPFGWRLHEIDGHLRSCPETELVILVCDYWNDARYSRYCATQAASRPVAPELMILLRVQGAFEMLSAKTYGCVP